MRRYITTPQFKKLIADGDHDVAQASILAKDIVFTRGADAPEGTVDIVASTGDRDRYGDRVSVKGWQLKSFKKNPVILWAHDHELPPVGRAIKIWTDKEALHKRVEFTPADLHPFGHMIGEMVRRGFLHTASVGFQATKWAPTKTMDGEDAEELARLFPHALDFIKQDLMESSIVAVPANPWALVEARDAGIDVRPFVEVAEKVLDHENDPGPVLDREWYARAYDEVVEDKIIVPLCTKEALRMTAKENVAEARKLLTDARTAAAEIVDDLQAVIVEACSEIEACLTDCDDLKVELSADTLARLEQLSAAMATRMPSPPVPEHIPEPVQPELKEEAPSAEDLAGAIEHLRSGLSDAIGAALDQRTGRLSD